MNSMIAIILWCAVVRGSGIELSDGWNVDDSLEIRKFDKIAARISNVELLIGEFEGGKNVKGITPIGFSVPDESFRMKMKNSSKK